MEKTLGCRYSSLLDLPYFDAPTMLVIALFVSRYSETLSEESIDRTWNTLCKRSFRINAMSVPSDIGRIPYKIEHALQLTSIKTGLCIIQLFAYTVCYPLKFWNAGGTLC